MSKGTAMNEILLVAILTLPNTGHVVYEVAGSYTNRRACEAARREQQQIPQTVQTSYMCLPKDYN
jgi:hypothetical protein